MISYPQGFFGGPSEKVAGSYNNFYEFSLDKEEVSKLAPRLTTSPWPIEIGGLVEKPMTIDAAELAEQFTLEERVYRFRRVEAWAMVVPWQYGCKSIKSIVKIEFVAEQPSTFWETLSAVEHPFESNVNPKIPHPRWSQAFERLIDTGDRVRTQAHNGYGNEVARLYGKG